MNCNRCGHSQSDHERETGPCNVKHIDRTHCICYQFLLCSHANTQWEQVSVSSETAKYLRGTHTLFSRLFDGEHVFTVRPIGEIPGPNDGGYYSISAALTVKGMKP